MRPQSSRQASAGGAILSSILKLTFVAALAIIYSAAFSVPSSLAQSGPEERPARFNIPAEPLARALERYGDATGREVLYDTGLALDRRSAAVDGLLTPVEALATLLQGTGLAASFMAEPSGFSRGRPRRCGRCGIRNRQPAS